MEEEGSERVLIGLNSLAVMFCFLLFIVFFFLIVCFDGSYFYFILLPKELYFCFFYFVGIFSFFAIRKYYAVTSKRKPRSVLFPQ